MAQGLGRQLLAGERLVCVAHEIAVSAHSGEMYGTEPFIVHPEAVAASLMADGYPPELVAGGYLHDAPENTGMSYEQLQARAHDISGCYFPKVTIDTVEAVTFTPADFLKAKESYREHTNKGALLDEMIRQVKIAKAKCHLGGRIVKAHDSARNRDAGMGDNPLPCKPGESAADCQDRRVRKHAGYVLNIRELGPLPTPAEARKFVANERRKELYAGMVAVRPQLRAA